MKVVTHIRYAVYTIDSAARNPRPPLVYCVQRENAHMKSVLLNITVVHELIVCLGVNLCASRCPCVVLCRVVAAHAWQR